MMLKSQENVNTVQSAYINEKCVSIQHEDNFHLLNLLLPLSLEEHSTFNSCNYNKPELIVHVSHKFTYTLELELHYVFRRTISEKIVIKIYQDAQVAEMVYCTNIQRFIRLMGPNISPEVHVKTRATLNNFLNKWLVFLLKSGYQRQKWIQKSDSNPSSS